MSKTQSPNYTKCKHKPQLRQGSVVLITGASSGLGKELALQISTRNVRMILAGRDEFRLKEVQELCSKNGKTEVSIFLGDLTIEENCKKLIDFAQQTYNKINYLFLNAGVNAHFQFQQLKDTTIFQKLMQVNFYSNVYLTKFALPMLKRVGGMIVVVSSLSGKFGLPSRSAYCASKFALTGFFESLRTELKISIMLVYPTSLETPMRQNSLIKAANESKENKEQRQDPKKCAEIIIKGIDEGKEDIYLPSKGRLGVVLQPIFPGFMRRKLMQASKL